MKKPEVERDKIIEILNCPKLEKGLNKYVKIKNEYELNGPSNAFRETYCSFYRLNKRSLPKDLDYNSFLKMYFDLLNEYQVKDASFKEIFCRVKELTKRNDISFASKLLHTLNNDYPIWDSVIRNNKNFDIKKPSANANIDKCVEMYNVYTSAFMDYLKTEECKIIISLFNEHFKDNNDYLSISDTKKVDFVLWQNR